MFVCGLSFFDKKKMHALTGRMELLQVCTYLWQDSEFAFECALCILLHLLDGDKSYVSESPQRSRGRCPVKDTGMPWSGACKYCQFSGKTENWYAFTGAQSKTQVALVRCSISVKELSIMHLITDYLRTH